MHFDLDDKQAYLRWRDQKQECAAQKDKIVEIKNPAALTSSEIAELFAQIARSNMVLYACSTPMDEAAVQRFAAQMGLNRLDANWLAGEAGISRIAVSEQASKRTAYIPYTDRAIKWHTDGYYNPPERTIRGMVLHCAQNAASGGENRLLDHEIAYMLLRDVEPEFVRALSAGDAMTIPERTDENGVARAAQTGPVFSYMGGKLHMRYTARTRSIEWKQDQATLAAVACLERILSSDCAHIRRLTMQAGMGLLCNNVLHDRSAFSDDPARPRLLYRARYLEPIDPARQPEQ